MLHIRRCRPTSNSNRSRHSCANCSPVVWLRLRTLPVHCRPLSERPWPAGRHPCRLSRIWFRQRSCQLLWSRSHKNRHIVLILDWNKCKFRFVLPVCTATKPAIGIMFTIVRLCMWIDYAKCPTNTHEFIFKHTKQNNIRINVLW